MRMLLLLLTLFSTGSAHSAALPREVGAALARAGIPTDSVAIEVRALGATTPLLSLHARQAMNPASTMKLLTTYAGLELLGPAWTWQTEAWLEGTLKEGVLEGNLVLKGYGDPKFTIEQFWLWLHELRGRGLRDIRGDLVLDRSYFELPPHDPAAFDNDPLRAYNVGPDALLLNFNTLRLRYLPDGNTLKVISEPPLDGVNLDNQLTPEPGKDCDKWDERLKIQARGDSVILQGGYPSECGEREQNLSVLPHSRFVATVFAALWQELGGMLRGTAREGQLGPNAKLFSRHRSEPLGNVIRDINKFSNNVMARQLYLTLGARDGGKATLAASEQAVHAWLQSKGLNFPELVLENGAGLSRRERISARHLADLLQMAANSPVGAEFIASLPILGVDGSVKNRLKDSPAASHAHLKTGTLEGVKAIAGYVRSQSGKEWIVVFLINHDNARAGQEAQDRLIEWLRQR